MFCPICKSEYEPGIRRCATDDVDLVDSLSDIEGDPSDARFVPLHTFSSPPEAEMISGLLQENGIRSAVQSGANDAFAPLLAAVSPGGVVLVDERDLDRARELYRAYFGEDTSPLTGPALDDEEEYAEDEGPE